MSERAVVSILPGVEIPLAELSFRASRSGGPGGQHVNTSSTRIELWWDAAGSPSLNRDQKTLVLQRIGNRLTEEGLLRLVASTTRSQAKNKEETIERFRELLARALVPVKKRKATKPGKAAKERRLSDKRAQSQRKAQRRPPRGDD